MAENGNIKIANDVVAVISGIAATEIDGIYGMSGGVVEGIAELLGRRNLGKGVKVEVGEEECAIDLYVVVEYGVRIPDVAKLVQTNVVKAVTSMTGLKVVEVNVFVQGIHIPEENYKDKNEKENIDRKLK